MELPEEEMKFMEPNITMFGYVLATTKSIGNDALKVASDYFYDFGKLTGQNVKQKMGITGSNAEAVAAVWSVTLARIGINPSAQIEGKKAVRVAGNKVVGVIEASAQRWQPST